MTFGTFTVLFNHHCHPPWELSHPPKLKLCPLKQQFPFPLPPPLVTTVLLSASMNRTILCTSQKWNRTVVVLLCLTYFIQHNSSRFIHVMVCVRTSFSFKTEQFPSHGCATVHLSIHPSMTIWVPLGPS